MIPIALNCEKWIMTYITSHFWFRILRQLVGQPAGDQQPSGLRLFAQTIGIADRVNWAGVPDQVPSPHFLVDLIVRRLRVIQSDFDFRPQNYEKWVLLTINFY